MTGGILVASSTAMWPVKKTPWLCHLVSSVQCPVSLLDPLSTTSTAISLGIMKPPTSPVDPPDSSAADLWGRNDHSELKVTVQSGGLSTSTLPPPPPVCHIATSQQFQMRVGRVSACCISNTLFVDEFTEHLCFK